MTALTLMLMFEDLRHTANKRRKICQEFLSTIEASGKSMHTIHVMCNVDTVNMIVLIQAYTQGSHASWKILESPGFFFFKFPGPGKSWKITLVLESHGN